MNTNDTATSITLSRPILHGEVAHQNPAQLTLPYPSDIGMLEVILTLSGPICDYLSKPGATTDLKSATYMALMAAEQEMFDNPPLHSITGRRALVRMEPSKGGKPTRQFYNLNFFGASKLNVGWGVKLSSNAHDLMVCAVIAKHLLPAVSEAFNRAVIEWNTKRADLASRKTATEKHQADLDERANRTSMFVSPGEPGYDDALPHDIPVEGDGE